MMMVRVQIWSFNPRLPCGRRPNYLREFWTQTGFNPRLPCGRRPQALGGSGNASLFQSTPPVWEATSKFAKTAKQAAVSIHASRVGGDLAL